MGDWMQEHRQTRRREQAVEDGLVKLSEARNQLRNEASKAKSVLLMGTGVES